MNGVIKTATGDLLRAGYTDFSTSPDFDEGTESYRTDVLVPALPRRPGMGGNMHRWNGAAWIEVPNVARILRGHSFITRSVPKSVIVPNGVTFLQRGTLLESGVEVLLEAGGEMFLL